MRHLYRSFVGMAIAAAIVGCGGGGTGSINPFAGTYMGTWSSTVPAQGSAVATVSNGGHLFGTTHDNSSGLDGSFDGTISPGGSVNITMAYPGQPNSNVSGTVQRDGGGNINGVLTQQFLGGATYNLTLNLTPL